MIEIEYHGMSLQMTSYRIQDFCRIEGKTFPMEKLKEFLKKMYHYKEDGVFPWQCNYCDKSTKTHDHMREHAQIHVENLEFDCYKCGKIFHRTNTLRGHRRSKCFQTQLSSSRRQEQ